MSYLAPFPSNDGVLVEIPTSIGGTNFGALVQGKPLNLQPRILAVITLAYGETRLYLESFWRGRRVWRRDRQTDR